MGFGDSAAAELVVVVQADDLNDWRPSVLIVPLDVPFEGDDADPTVIRVSRKETGERAERVALVTQLRSIGGEALAPGAVGRLSAESLEQLDVVLLRVLGL